ncbi:hypothetical protein K501DRAFT_336421 [Backusella circina FSU 941]|nr:hypothetical protein K501DRAFT_336421 [Backusella circina FSU 941]
MDFTRIDFIRIDYIRIDYIRNGFIGDDFYERIRCERIIYKWITDVVNDSAVTGSTDSGHSSLVTYCASQVFKQSGQNTYERRLKMLRTVILLGFTSLTSLAMKEPGHTSPVTYCEPLLSICTLHFMM